MLGKALWAVPRCSQSTQCTNPDFHDFIPRRTYGQIKNISCCRPALAERAQIIYTRYDALILEPNISTSGARDNIFLQHWHVGFKWKHMMWSRDFIYIKLLSDFLSDFPSLILTSTCYHLRRRDARPQFISPPHSIGRINGGQASGMRHLAFFLFISLKHHVLWWPSHTVL